MWKKSCVRHSFLLTIFFLGTVLCSRILQTEKLCIYNFFYLCACVRPIHIFFCCCCHKILLFLVNMVYFISVFSSIYWKLVQLLNSKWAPDRRQAVFGSFLYGALLAGRLKNKQLNSTEYIEGEEKVNQVISGIFYPEDIVLLADGWDTLQKRFRSVERKELPWAWNSVATSWG